MIAFGDESATRLQKIEHRGEEQSRLLTEIEAAQAELVRVGRELSKLRLKAAPLLSGAVREQLRDLGFKKSEFDIHLVQLDAPGANGLETIEFVFAPRSSGLETVEFLFAPNPGEPPKPLRSIGSSGEISRVNAGGKERARRAGRRAAARLRRNRRQRRRRDRPRRRRQDACARWSASSFGHHAPSAGGGGGSAHYVVTKEFTDERTYSRLGEVKTKARVREIARMLGGQSDSAVALAKNLLSGKAAPQEK